MALGNASYRPGRSVYTSTRRRPHFDAQVVSPHARRNRLHPMKTVVEPALLTGAY